VTFARHPAPGPLLAAMAALAAVTALGAAGARHAAAVGLAHDFLPVVTTIAIFELLGPIIPAVNAARWDETFAALDRRLFDGLRAAWLGVLGRPAWLTDATSVAYVAYYLLPVALSVGLYLGGRRDAFRHFVFTIVATFFVSYTGYLLFPTFGPRSDDDAALGGVVGEAVRTFVRVAEGNPFDAFPSGHTAVSVVCFGLGWHLFPRWRAPLALVVAGIVFATVYLSYHYVVDVVAGAALGLVLLAVLPPIARRFAAGG